MKNAYSKTKISKCNLMLNEVNEGLRDTFCPILFNVRIHSVIAEYVS